MIDPFKYKEWANCLLICLILLLPARTYNGMYLPFFMTDSNIHVQYMNVAELFILIVACIVSFTGKREHNGLQIKSVVACYIFINLFMIGMLFLFGDANYVGELFSKSITVACAGSIAANICEYSTRKLTSIYVLSFLILVSASFFLSDYGAFAEMNRVGTLGFGSNETAFFSCFLLAYAFFMSKELLVIRILLGVVSLSGILNVASRRGAVIAFIVIVLGVINIIFNKKSSIEHRTRPITYCVGLGAVILFCFFYNSSYFEEKVLNSSLVHRYTVSAQSDNSLFFDISSRQSIYKEILGRENYLRILGGFGCDKILAQNDFTHCHNDFLQLIVSYGAVFGTILIGYYIYIFCLAVRLFVLFLKDKSDPFAGVISISFILYFFFETFGYMLWNPKGLFLITTTMFLIQIENSKQKNSNLQVEFSKNV